MPMLDMNVVMVTGDGRFIEVQGTANESLLGRGALNAMLLLAEIGSQRTTGITDRSADKGKNLRLTYFPPLLYTV